MLFKEQISRKPNLYPWTDDFIKSMWKGHWTPDEFSFTSDKHQFKTELTSDEQDIIVKTLSAIGQIEIAVKKFWSKLGDNLPHPSISDLGITMSNIEVIHNQAYEKLLDVLELHHVFEENLKLDIIGNRVKYLRKYLEKNYDDDKRQYIYSLILFTLFVENVSLFSQFYIILWFNRNKNVLKDTSQQVQYTKNEELIHGLAGSKIINTLREEYPKLFDQELFDKVKRAAKEAYKAEEKIIDWILGNYAEPGLDAKILKEFIKNRINISLKQINFEEAFSVDSVLIEKALWMEETVMADSVTDFFHKRPVEYVKTIEVVDSDDLF